MSAFMGIVRSLAARLGRGRTSILVAAALVPALTAAVLVAALVPALDASSRIPVAVVNLDEGAVDADGRNVQAGSDLVDSLLDSDELAWSEVGASEAEQALEIIRRRCRASRVRIPSRRSFASFPMARRMCLPQKRALRYSDRSRPAFVPILVRITF